jgi:hypothetical protein
MLEVAGSNPDVGKSWVRFLTSSYKFNRFCLTKSFSTWFHFILLVFESNSNEKNSNRSWIQFGFVESNSLLIESNSNR